jgi:glycosyltransferase 2 family protein
LKETHFLRRHAGKLVVSAVITVSLVYALQSGGIKVWPEGVSFAGIKPWAVALYVVTLTAMNYFRATRWRFLLRAVVDVPKRRLVAVSWIGFAAILVLPFRIGEFVRPYMLSVKKKTLADGRVVPEASMSMATGSVVAERVTDALYLSIVLAIALLAVPTIQPLPDTVIGLPISVRQVRYAGFTMLGFFTTAFAVLAVFYFARAWMHKATLAIFGIVSRPLGEKLARIAEGVADGLHFLSRPKDALPFLLETSAYWGFNVVGMWLLARFSGIVHADGSPATLGEACALMGMLGVTILIPGPPGMLGVFQAGIYAGMTMYYPTAVITGAGAAYVFTTYAVQLVWTLSAGAAGFLIDREALEELGTAEASKEEEEDAGGQSAGQSAGHSAEKLAPP